MEPAAEHIREIVEAYLAVFPQERERLAPLTERLAAPEEIQARHRMDGHVTGSAFVVDPRRRLVLLIHHRTLGRWFQPGGHVEADETPAIGAEREAREETGLQALFHAPWCGEIQLPIDIDPHRIPANAKRGEGEHWHFDMRYLFVADARSPLLRQAEEIADVRWAPLAEVAEADPGIAIAARKIEAWLDSEDAP